MPPHALKMSHTRLAWNLFRLESVHHDRADPFDVQTDERETAMSHSSAIAKIASVASLGIFAATLLAMVLAPAPSLFAG